MTKAFLPLALLLFCILSAHSAFAQAPTLQSVTSNSQTVTLTVQTTTSLTTSYYLWRSTTSGAEGNARPYAVQTVLGSVSPVGSTIQLTDPTAASGQTYYYRVSIASNNSTTRPQSNELSVVSQVTVPMAVTALSINPNSVAGGNSTTGTVTVSEPAPANGVVVGLDNGSQAGPVPATVPSSVFVAPGASSVAFSITTTAVTTSTPATITATYNGASKSAALTVDPAPTVPTYLSNLTLNATAIIGGNSTTGTVTLSSSVSVATTVALSSNNSAVGVPPNVVIPAGAVTKTFPVTSLSVSLPTDVYLLATSNGWSQATALTVMPINQSFTVQNVIAAPGNNCIVLNWSDLDAGITRGYNVYRRQGTGAATLLTATPQEAPIYADTNVSNGLAYQYQVSAIGVDGTELGFSTWVNATPDASAQTFNWVNPPSSATDTITLNAAFSGGLSTSACSLLVDGKEVSSGDDGDQDNSSAQPSSGIISILDTSDLSNGMHVVQLVDTTGYATPPLSLLVNNIIGGIDVTPLFDGSTNEPVLVDASLSNNPSGYDVNVTDDETGVLVRSWRVFGSNAHLAWDGKDASGVLVPEDDYTVQIVPDTSGQITPNFTGPQPGKTRGVAHVIGSPNGLGLIDYISPQPSLDDALFHEVVTAFRQMHANEPSFVGRVVRRSGSNKRDRTRVYKRIKKWMQNSVYDFYQYGHGHIGVIGELYRFRWRGLRFWSSRPGNDDPKDQAVVQNNPLLNLVVPEVTAGRQYNFAFLDSCWSAGGHAAPPTDDEKPGGPVTRVWADAFNISTDPENFSCFLGWSGLCALNDTIPSGSGKPNDWIVWRLKFWQAFEGSNSYGKLISQAVQEATDKTIRELNVGNCAGTPDVPWDQYNSVYRSQRKDDTFMPF